MKHGWLLLAALVAAVAGFSQELRSPDGRLKLTFALQADGVPAYSLDYGDMPVLLASRMGFVLTRPQKEWAAVSDPPANALLRLTHGFTATSIRYDTFDETWHPVWGEERTIRNRYNEMAVSLLHDTGIELRIRFRLFDDGLGFRYEFPEQKGLTCFVVRDERTEFALTGDHRAYWIPGDYGTQEFDYTVSTLSRIEALFDEAVGLKRIQQLASKRVVQTALQLKTDRGLYINLHEAALTDYPCMLLELGKTGFTFTSHLTPDALGNKAYLQTPCHTPWRTAIVSDDARRILASRLTLNLNEPCKIEDTSWIRPLKYMGVWWEMITGKSSWSYTDEFPSVRLRETDYRKARPHGRHGATTDKVLHYLDFAAAHGFDALLVEGWNVGWEDWEGNWKEQVFDFVTPYPDFDLERVTAYARNKGVQLIMHHETSGSVSNYERSLDTAYRFLVAHGYRAVKSGYVGRIIPRGEYHYGQWMVNHYLHAVERAACYRITVNAHEAVRPTGLCRTWPNLVANESARGTEYHALGGIRPHHAAILPFTRLIGGPMDYTPGIFEMDLSRYNPRNRSRAQCTIANQLALYVTLPSPMQMACDLPQTYERFPDAFGFIEEVALDWERSIYLEAEPAEYVTVARKAKGSQTWFVGSIAGAHAHDARIAFGFLDPGVCYTATVYSDAADTDYRTNPQAYQIRRIAVNSRSELVVPCVAAGGCALKIEPAH